ncbi:MULTISPECIES: cysteine desulfurase family protein [Rhizobium/Agrobacterium group]|uniref:cysteine desulfurase family protein n=1 Tax=Rhizobium/Agrobacterium group TaxID=227290 RepID=UPI00107F1D2B|nr:MULTISPECIES: cysteine desulfurase family protein [Rhizobium/Agrobacterium group]MBB4399408.1 cysteine desulfurase [Agrobacterium radiobacter]MBB5585562.1 cysteine desulfurase [Agrobacterium radiobacter]TGE86165.1 cysteine desulfurase [Rhizobium sp. SEMIA 4032]
MTVLTRTYMDWNATAPLLPAVRDVLVSALDLAGNPSSVHREGRAARAAVEGARREVAALVSGQAAHVTFTSGATEAANLVLTPDFKMGRAPVRYGHLYVSAIEHPAFREGGRFSKADVTEIPVTSAGVIDLAALEALLSSHDASTGLPMVACMMVNNETGILQPVAEAARLVHAAGGLMVVDAVQAAGRVPLDINALDVDFLVISSHKLGGPKGTGALVSRGEVMMPKPLIHGGGQEKGHRSGTENTLSVIGFGAAAAVATRNLEIEAVRLAALRARLEDGMRVSAPDVIIHGEDVARVGNTTFFTLPGLKAETGQIAFDIEGIALSAGSACSSGKVGESHVLTAMGRDPKLGALRISLGHATDEADIERTLAAFTKIAGRRRLAGQAA